MPERHKLSSDEEAQRRNDLQQKAKELVGDLKMPQFDKVKDPVPKKSVDLEELRKKLEQLKHPKK